MRGGGRKAKVDPDPNLTESWTGYNKFIKYVFEPSKTHLNTYEGLRAVL